MTVSLHKCIHVAMSQLAERALEGLLCITHDKQSLLLHLIISAYVVELSYSKHLLVVKRKTRILCHALLVIQAEKILHALQLHRDIVGPRQRLHWKEPKILLNKNKTASRTWRMALLPPLTVWFLYHGIYSRVVMYAIFYVGLMHNLFVNVSWMLEECLRNMMIDGSCFPNASERGFQT